MILFRIFSLTTYFLFLVSCSSIFHDHPTQEDYWTSENTMLEGQTYSFQRTIIFTDSFTIPPNVTIRLTGEGYIGIREHLSVSEGVTFEMAESSSILTLPYSKPCPSISINGTKSNPVLFKSLNQSNYWNGITISAEADTNNSFNFAVIENASNGIICERKKGLILNNSQITNCINNGLVLHDSSATSISNSLFSQNGNSDIYSIGNNIESFDSTNITDSRIILESAVVKNYTFSSHTYTISKRSLELEGNNSISPGAIFIFDDAISLRVIEGKLNVNGSQLSPVIFKASDGEKWAGLVFENTTSQSTIDFAQISSTFKQAIWLNSSNLKLQNSSISDYSKYAIVHDTNSTFFNINNEGFDSTHIALHENGVIM